MTNFKASHEHWDDLEQWANNGSRASTDHCILELRSRIEALEKAQSDKYFEAAKTIVDAYKTTPNLKQVRRTLVERVQIAIDNEYENSLGNGNSEAKAAILEVVEWLHEEMWPEPAQEIEEEVKR